MNPPWPKPRKDEACHGPSPEKAKPFIQELEPRRPCLNRKTSVQLHFRSSSPFSARLETNSFQDGLARNAHRVSSAIRRNFGRNFVQLRRKSAQPSATSTTAQILVTTLAPSRWLLETLWALCSPKTFEHTFLYRLGLHAGGGFSA